MLDRVYQRRECGGFEWASGVSTYRTTLALANKNKKYGESSRHDEQMLGMSAGTDKQQISPLRCAPVGMTDHVNNVREQDISGAGFR
jgi:hypothetical protein